MHKQINVRHTSIVIPNYNLGDNPTIEKMLSRWNASYYRFDPIAFAYNEETKELRVPRGLNIGYLEKTFRIPANMDRTSDEFEPASIRLKTEPKSDIQRKAISYLIGEDTFAYTKKHSQLSLNLDTGDGKTYCGIAAMTFMKVKTLIITHNDNIKGQWLSSFAKMSDIDPKHILNISGSAMINKILKMDKIPFKVFLINHRSLQSYGSKNGWDKVGELFRKLKVGLKIYDEAHLEFENLMNIDLHTNTKKTVYLTATFDRSHFKESKLFNICFSNIVRYGVETRQEKRKHIICVIIKFNSKATVNDRLEMKNKHGLDKNKYLDYQLSKPKFYKAISYVMDYIGDKEGKRLVLLSKNEAIEKMYTYLEENNTDKKKIGIYNSLVTDEEKIAALDGDIILSTPKSLGTGSDIPGLRFNLMTEPYRSSIAANQISGRLREYGPEMYTFHFEFVDVSIPEVVSMLNSRLPTFKAKCFKVIVLAPDELK